MRAAIYPHPKLCQVGTVSTTDHDPHSTGFMVSESAWLTQGCDLLWKGTWPHVATWTKHAASIH